MRPGGGDLRDLVTGESTIEVDLSETPMLCDICPDVETHVRLTTASHARDADDLRGVMQVLGLLPSPPPDDGTFTDSWGKRKQRRHNNKEDE